MSRVRVTCNSDHLNNVSSARCVPRNPIHEAQPRVRRRSRSSGTARASDMSRSGGDHLRTPIYMLITACLPAEMP